MSVKITIPNTSSDYLTFGSANTPDAAKIGGYEDSTGNGHLELYTTASGTSTERMRIDASGDVGIGTSSPTTKLTVGSITDTNITAQVNASGTGLARFIVNSNGVQAAEFGINTSGSTDSYGIVNNAVGLHTLNTLTPLTFGTNATERMRIDSSGNVLVGTTSTINGPGKIQLAYTQGTQVGIVIKPSANSATAIQFLNAAGSQVGYISTTSTTTGYATSSDYRLKENIAPMTGALEKVTQLKPVTYTWKVDGSHGEGFIAHELQAVVPDCVTGEKDAVDEEGNPIYQGIDTSFLVATLTAAIQELKAELDTVKSELATLKGTV